MKAFVCFLLVISVLIAVLYGGCKAFDYDLYLRLASAFSSYFVDVPRSLSDVWTHDYFNINTGITWVDSILGDGLVEGIVNTCYRVIDTFKVMGSALKNFLIAEVYLTPWSPRYFTSIQDDIYKWDDNQYIYDDVFDGAEEENVLPTVPGSGHAGGR